MATYFHGAPEMQSDGLQTLYLMNPAGYAGYPDAAPPATDMVFMNSTFNSTLNPMMATVAHNPQPDHQQQHLVGIPLHPMMPLQDPSRRPVTIGSPQEVSAVHGLAPRVHYNLWTPAPASPSQPQPHRPSPQKQGLSLSLSPQQQTQYAPYRPEHDVSPTTEMKASNGLQSALMGSKYLKAAQLLLDEVVSVDNGDRGNLAKARPSSRKSEGAVAEADSNTRRGADLTAAERQELQMKKVKLVSMLDEVEQRYRQYRHQMQIVVSSFEAMAGFRSARTYTALALETISKQFRCLRDAVTDQIRATSKSLGEEECAVGAAKSGGSKLRFVDHQLRQQKALQQLGMIQHNAWRPQRGLPERAVSVLRAWLFEHFLHPYPKDADKHMLAKQTGLTRSQVSNWFINARVRLWKPMVEEMYMQEFKEQEQTNAGENNFDSKEEASSNSSALKQRSPTRMEQNVTLQKELDILNDPRAPPMNPIAIPRTVSEVADNHETIMQASLKKARNEQPVRINMKPDTASNSELLMKFIDGGSSWRNGYPLIPGAINNGGGGFGSYSIGEIGKFNHEQFAPRFSGNSVSLTLGLPHSENLSRSGQQQQQQHQQHHYLSSESNQLGRRVDMSTESTDYCSLNSSSNPTASSHPLNAYESINIQNRKRFAAQLLPDFVA